MKTVKGHPRNTSHWATTWDNIKLLLNIKKEIINILLILKYWLKLRREWNLEPSFQKLQKKETKTI